MSGTPQTPDQMNNASTGIFRDGQAAGSIVPVDVRTAVESGAGLAPSANSPQSGTYTVALTDRGSLIEFTSSSAQVMQIPTDASVAFAIGDVICGYFSNATGAPLSSIAAVSPGTTTVNSSSSLNVRAQFSMVFVRKHAANLWVAYGDLV